MRKWTSLVAAVAVALFVSVSIAQKGNGDSKGVKVGDSAPSWTLQDQNGKTHNLSDFSDKIVVLEWFNEECPYVVRHYKDGDMNATAAKYAEKGVVWIAVNSSSFADNARNAKTAQSWKMERPILNDSTGVVGKAYGARTTPHMYIIKDGKIAYMGGIDNNAQGNVPAGEVVNYVAKALDELLAGQSVSTPETRPYGCSVKYGK